MCARRATASQWLNGVPAQTLTKEESREVVWMFFKMLWYLMANSDLFKWRKSLGLVGCDWNLWLRDAVYSLQELSAHNNLEQMSVNRACFFFQGLWKFFQGKSSNTQWKKGCRQTELQLAEKPKACLPFQPCAYVFYGMKCDMHSRPRISSWESVICDGSIKHTGPHSKELMRNWELRTQMALKAPSAGLPKHPAHSLGKSNTLCYNLHNWSRSKIK